MLKKPKEEESSPNVLGPLCKQLVTMCQSSREERDSKQELNKGVTLDENLTQLIGSSSNSGQNEQNPHEDFYRRSYEH